MAAASVLLIGGGEGLAHDAGDAHHADDGPGVNHPGVAAAVSLLQAGGLVALPTETVYGLAADAANPAAVARLYAAKGRPAGHPVIVHLADASTLTDWATDVPAYARALVEACWPGPLTLVLRRAPGVADHVTAGHPTIGLRCPDHPVALAVLHAFGGGLAAPSANRFGRVSPTTAQHVLEELGDVLEPGRDGVLDGGTCPVGIESTIVDATTDHPRLLRPGGVSSEQIAVITGLAVETVSRASGSDDRPAAPGTLPAHYAPRTPVTVCEADDVGAAVMLLMDRWGPEGPIGPVLGARAPAIGLIAGGEVGVDPGLPVLRLAAPVDDADYAHALYAALRQADTLELDAVIAVPPTHGPLAPAIRDRLVRAAAGSA